MTSTGQHLQDDAPDPYALDLLPHHAKLLAASAISVAVARARRYRSVEKKSGLELKGFGRSQRVVPTLLIPIFGTTGQCMLYQHRPDEPRVKNGKPLKYETVAGSRLTIDVPPSIRHLLGDPAVPLFVTEGVRKADSAASQGLCCLDILGVWGWRGTNAVGGKTALADWERVALNDRHVYLVFDSDVITKPEVAAALSRLKSFLQSGGANVLIVYLPPGPNGTKVGLDDFLAGGHDVADLFALATPELRPSVGSHKIVSGAATTATDRMEIIITGRFMRETSEDALAALSRANDPPFIFRRGTAICRLVESTSGEGPKAQALDFSSLKGVLDRTADFVKLTQQGLSPARPPADVLNDVLTLPPSAAPLPALSTIASVPVFLKDGRLLASDGYDSGSGLYLHLNELQGAVADLGLEEAKQLLFNDLLIDFPFVDDAARAHALCLILQPFLRPMISGPTPLYLLEAPTPGTGKDLLASVAAIVALGRQAPTMPLSRDEDEIDKRITSMLMQGNQIVLLDNVTELKSTTLDAVLTTTRWQGRLLGHSQMVEVPNESTWIATANNPDISDEIARRTIPIRLDSGVERPWERSEFKHPQLVEWALEQRPHLVSACLSVIQIWVEAGMPKGQATLGSFEVWASVMGGVLDVAGVSGFLGGRGALYEAADRESRDWCVFSSAWWKRYEDKSVGAKDLLEIAKERQLLLDVWGGRTALGALQRLGRAVWARRDRVFGPFRIREAGQDAQTGNHAYRLERNDRQTNAGNTGNAGGEYARGNSISDKTPETPPRNTPCSGSTGSVSGVSGVLAQARQVDDDGRRVYALALGEALDYPTISLGTRMLGGQRLKVGVSAGRARWEYELSFLADDLLEVLCAILVELTSGR